jgi:tetraacyldisaccharide 4'-kinase
VSGLATIAERVWYGRGIAPAVARAALGPLALLYGAGTAGRAMLYDRAFLRSHRLALPALSVGNLTVGGTGKTPVSAWIATQLLARGARPAIVLRGYGDDEPAVHALLNPMVPVVATPDRVLGAREAAGVGADVVVLDDAFQHRRAARMADLVLVSAERFGDRSPVRLLPAGPYREPLSALARADLAVVTRKTADPAHVARTLARLSATRADLPVAVVELALDELRAWAGRGGDLPSRVDDVRQPLDALDGARVLAVAAVGEPAAFFAQLAERGAVVERAAFPDHHRFTAADAEALAARAVAAERVVCTLKDAVKLGPLWPRQAPPLWYVSQRVVVERGAELLDACLARVLAARPTGP